MTNGFSGAKAFSVFAALASFLFSADARAELGQPRNWQLGFQEAATPIMRQLTDFHNFLLVLTTVITLFVMGLLVYVALRFNENANPKPSKTSHHTLLEVAWTVVPILILVAISIPSFRLLHLQYSYPKADITIKATGYTWYWTHAYPDLGDFSFETRMLDDASREELIAENIPAPRNLAVDNEVVVPVNKVVNVLVTADPEGVIHDWTIPSFGSKVDAVPGRVTTTWFKPTVEGIFYGQCSELCGKDHAFMPIGVRVVSEETFAAWSEAMQAANAAGTDARGEKDKTKRREILREKKNLLKKAKEIIREAALRQSGNRKLAQAGAAETR
ncbi:MAG: cytochrome c oxidase subunit II [Hyphomicrobiaceae bacterium]|nr:cytochrome c oxidase subunit II [Hyphomicrobiaceae bacterium]